MAKLLSNKYICVDSNDSVSKILGKLHTKKSKEALVFDNTRFTGLIDERKLLKLRLNPETKIKKVTTKAPRIKDPENIGEIARLMETSNNVMLPYLKDKQVIGVIYVWDVLKECLTNNKIKQLKCADVCSKRKLTTLNETDTISKAVAEFRKKGLNRLPVVKKNKLVGIVTPRDLLKKYYIFDLSREGTSGKRLPRSSPAKKISVTNLPVKNEMETIIKFIERDDKLTKAIRKMVKNKITCVIITTEGVPDSIITLNDVLRLYK